MKKLKKTTKFELYIFFLYKLFSVEIICQNKTIKFDLFFFLCTHLKYYYFSILFINELIS